MRETGAMWMRVGGFFLTVKGAAFLGVAALGLTPLPPLLLAGLSLTWVTGGVGLLAGARSLTAKPAVEHQEDAQTAGAFTEVSAKSV